VRVVRAGQLSKRELQIVERVTFGEGNPAIGRYFDISEETVKRHLSTACDALGLDNRTQLAVWFERKYGVNKELATTIAQLKSENQLLRRQLVHEDRAKVKL
jgi:DNA-binding CsgD family transcriptional regulator